MEKRWLVFFFVVMAIMMFFQSLQPPPQPPKKPTAATAPAATQPTETAATAPADEAGEVAEAATAPATQVVEEPGEIVTVATDSYSVNFNTRGAVPVSWMITDPAYQLKDINGGGKPTSIEMIPPIKGATDREYPLQFFLKEAQTTRGVFDAFNRRNYEVSSSTDGKGNRVVTFTSPVLPEGLQLIKTYRLPKNGFLSDFQLKLINRSKNLMRFADEEMGPGTNWGPGLGGETDIKGFGVPQMPDTAVWLTDGKPENKPSTGMDLGESVNFNVNPKWAGMTNRYFFATLIPQDAGDEPSGVRVTMKTRNTPPGEKKGFQTIELFQKPLELKPGASETYDYKLFVGPKSKRVMWSEEYEKYGLDQILFYNSWRWFRALCLGLMWGLIQLRGFLPDYGWAIIALTIILRLFTQPFVMKSQKASARFAQAQKKLKPEMDEIAKKFKDNPQKRNEETWKLYKKHNVNPLGALKGCVWAFVQMPFFFAFYKLLLMSIELRGANFLWISDLSQPDRLVDLPAWFPLITAINLLPILMTVSQYGTQKLMMTTSIDPTQKQMMYMMPAFMLFVMYNMSSGLVLYWFISNLWQIGSQLYINRKVKAEEASGQMPHAGMPPAAPTTEAKPPRRPRGR